MQPEILIPETIFIDTILPLRHGVFTYHLAENQNLPSVGFQIVVPLGKNLYSGVVIAIHKNKPQFKTRPVIFIPERNPIATPLQMKFWNWVAGYYLCSIGEVLDAALPSMLKVKSEAIVSLSDGALEMMDDPFDETVYNYLNECKLATINQLIDLTKTRDSLPLIYKMIERGFLIFANDKTKYKPLIEKRYRLKADSYNEALSVYKRSPKKLELIEYLYANTGRSKTPVDIRSESGLSMSIIKSVLLGSFVDEEITEISRISGVFDENAKPIVLSEYQQKAFNEIEASLLQSKPVLLEGVTGSGKTEIYIKLIEKAIAQNKQTLYLLPEIVLSSQIIKRLQHYFGDKVCIYHSRINQSERAEIWYNILSGDRFKVVVGPRSAIFLPYHNLGFVIVDEEHDPGFKQQDPAPRYNARDAAIVLSQLTKSWLLLGSATPSFESIQNVNSNKYLGVKLTQRYGNSPMPEVEIVDYRKWYRRHEVVGHLTPILKEYMERSFQKDEQVILLQNRRGFAPFVQCPSCGYIPQCKHCDVSLTAHKFSNKLTCHYCGYYIIKPVKCPQCNNDEFVNQGFGTERVEEELKEIFPDKKIARLDSDTARSKQNLEEVISRFAEGKTDILIGTQMVSKGLDFGGVNLVGVLNADNMLSFPDFRSHERGFQMLMQFAGRAGRRNQQGKVIIQTSQLDHPVIQAIQHSKQHEFVKVELAERLNFEYPPFIRLIQLTVKHFDRQKTDKAAEILIRLLNKSGIQKILGPYIPPIPKIKRQQHSQIMIKLDRNVKLMEYRDKVIQCIETVTSIDGFKSVKIVADVDPY
ncbi:MAG: primosomal protein N' [Salinivirgaceae bacterium]|nr:primosomal protein N' [Salinivirgaceae bacterium]MDD4746210.1 primosomal protein N' [Salinivirgaceae bacterium]